MTLDELVSTILHEQSKSPDMPLQSYFICMNDWVSIKAELYQRTTEEGREFKAADIDRPNFLVCGVPVCCYADVGEA